MSFVNELLKAMNEWNKDTVEDEWLFARFIEQYVDTLSPSDAFQAINNISDILTDLLDESTAVDVLQIIIYLARQSKTTEVPVKLLKMKKPLINQFENMGDDAHDKLNELFKYYCI